MSFVRALYEFCSSIVRLLTRFVRVLYEFLSMEKLSSLFVLGSLGITLGLCSMLMENVMANYQKRGDGIDGGQEGAVNFKVMVKVNDPL